MDDDIELSLELTIFTFNIKSKLLGVLDSFFHY
jgi:hypothetical protein